MKRKVKQMACMVCAFVLSFILTVTAFADTTGFDYYVGVYNNPYGSGHVTLGSDHLFYLVAYWDADKKCSVSGNYGEGRLGAGKTGFNARFSTAMKTTSTGALPDPAYRETFIDYIASGEVIKLTKTTIYSDQSDREYVKS